MFATTRRYATWYNSLVVYIGFCNSIIPQKRLLSYPFRMNLQSFLLGLFFYSPQFLSFENVSAAAVNAYDKRKIIKFEPFYRFTAEVVEGDNLAFADRKRR